jgi:hypothetical protein
VMHDLVAVVARVETRVGARSLPFVLSIPIPKFWSLVDIPPRTLALPIPLCAPYMHNEHMLILDLSYIYIYIYI